MSGGPNLPIKWREHLCKEHHYDKKDVQGFISVILQNGDEIALEKASDSGLFSGPVKGLIADDIYTLSIQTDEGHFQRYDPYQFQQQAYHFYPLQLRKYIFLFEYRIY